MKYLHLPGWLWFFSFVQEAAGNCIVVIIFLLVVYCPAKCPAGPFLALFRLICNKVLHSYWNLQKTCHVLYFATLQPWHWGSVLHLQNHLLSQERFLGNLLLAPHLLCELPPPPHCYTPHLFLAYRPAAESVTRSVGEEFVSSKQSCSQVNSGKIMARWTFPLSFGSLGVTNLSVT